VRRLLVLAVLLSGCCGQLADKPATEPQGPKVGEKTVVTLPVDVWVNLQHMRKPTPDNDSARVGILWPGDLVEVLEIGPDYVTFDGIRKNSGDPLVLHGFARKWWEPR
jgi:hypothetical protein